MDSFLPATLLTKSGPKPTAEVLAGKKAIGFYFSAHWCPVSEVPACMLAM